ncbi:MAG: 3-keto-5-aminohexanoate cleavage protein [bacterium]
MEKLIITVAPTGSVPKKKDNPHVPVTPQEVIECALACEEKGASILHIHARDAQENPSDDPAFFQEVVEGLRGRSRLILQVSTGGRAGSNLESRMKRLQVKPEMASLTTGSVNFPKSVYMNPPELIEGLAQEMLRLGIKPEMEIFDLSMIYNAVALLKKGLAREPLHFNFVMGLKGAVPATIDHLVYMRRCLPEGSTWTVSGIAASQLSMALHAILMGGHVRVGLEDNLLLRKGELATNQALVERVAGWSRQLGREVASPDEARAILGLG